MQGFTREQIGKRDGYHMEIASDKRNSHGESAMFKRV